jgi:hypothetical protein
MVTLCKSNDDGENWRWIKQRNCHKDGKIKGVYINTCAGDPVKGKNIKSACSKSGIKNKKIVQCKDGKELKTFYCGSDGADIKKNAAVFEETCSGEPLSYKKNLKRLCKKYPGMKLVSCKNVCTQKKGTVCKDRTWKLNKTMICQDSKVTKSKIRGVKFKKCTPQQVSGIEFFLKSSEKKLDAVIGRAEARVSDNKLSKKQMRKLNTTIRKMKKINKKLSNLNITFICQSETKGCRNLVTAHTWFWQSSSIYLCSKFFEGRSDINNYQEGTIIHEIAHNYQALDAEDFSKTSPPRDGKIVPWEQNAETYDYWITNKFCVPEVDCAN